MARPYKRKFTMRSPEEKEAIILAYFNAHHGSTKKQQKSMELIVLCLDVGLKNIEKMVLKD